jgi:aspartate racemase
MKTIGICIVTIEGGVVCHQEISREAARRGIAYPEIVTHTPLFETIGEAAAHGNFGSLASTLADSINKTARAGAEFAIIPSNTVHLVFEETAAKAKIPLLSILDVTAGHCKKAGYRRVGILGTAPTMQHRLYDRPLKACGIEAVYPDPDDQAALTNIILNELVRGIFLDATTACLEGMAQKLAKEADAIVLGCTELPLVMTEAGCRTALVDTTRILAHAALDLMRRSMPQFQMTYRRWWR